MEILKLIVQRSYLMHMKESIAVVVLMILMWSCTTRKVASQDVETAQATNTALDTSLTCVYSWSPTYDWQNKLVNRIAVPVGFERVEVVSGSFGEWLRNLPLKPGRPMVHLYDGSLKINQGAHFAVIEIDVGTRDLQQCADAVMRLRAEYLYSRKMFDELSFNFTSGFPCAFEKWAQGFRPVVKGNDVSWSKSASPSSGYESFRSYMNSVFMYAGTYSLSQSMESQPLDDIQAGDVFIKGGFPGHAVIVLDVARNKVTNERIFLLAQSYMPAQEIHVLQNFSSPDRSPWYTNRFTGNLQTPEWTFEQGSLKGF